MQGWLVGKLEISYEPRNKLVTKQLHTKTHKTDETRFENSDLIVKPCIISNMYYGENH